MTARPPVVVRTFHAFKHKLKRTYPLWLPEEERDRAVLEIFETVRPFLWQEPVLLLAICDMEQVSRCLYRAKRVASARRRSSDSPLHAVFACPDLALCVVSFLDVGDAQSLACCCRSMADADFQSLSARVPRCVTIRNLVFAWKRFGAFRMRTCRLHDTLVSRDEVCAHALSGRAVLSTNMDYRVAMLIGFACRFICMSVWVDEWWVCDLSFVRSSQVPTLCSIPIAFCCSIASALSNPFYGWSRFLTGSWCKPSGAHLSCTMESLLKEAIQHRDTLLVALNA